MDFRGVLRRANLHAVEQFLLHGGETFAEISSQNYQERLREAEQTMTDFLKTQYPDPKTLDRVWGHLGEQIEIIENVYFEVGMLAGAQLAFQLRGRMEELL